MISSSPSESLYRESNESTSDVVICSGGIIAACTRDSRLSFVQGKAGNTCGRSCTGDGPSRLLGVGKLWSSDAGELRGEGTDSRVSIG